MERGLTPLVISGKLFWTLDGNEILGMRQLNKRQLNSDYSTKRQFNKKTIYQTTIQQSDNSTKTTIQQSKTQQRQFNKYNNSTRTIQQI